MELSVAGGYEVDLSGAIPKGNTGDFECFQPWCAADELDGLWCVEYDLIEERHPTRVDADAEQIHPRTSREGLPLHMTRAADLSALGMAPASLPKAFPNANLRRTRSRLHAHDRCARLQQ